MEQTAAASRRNPPTGTDGEHATFCRICEAFCGLVATVKDGKVAALRPDRDNPHSQGHVCVKGIAMRDVTYDPDRVVTPLKRVGGPGQFAPVGWDEALDDIAARLLAIRGAHGGDAIASYLGNPTAFSTNGFCGFNEFMAAIGSSKPYGSGSQDSNARLTANYMLYGSPEKVAIADLVNCDFLLVIGANPLVSNGWMMNAPRLRHDLDGIAERGRVVVVDPRRTETAQRYEHIAVKADTDVFLMLGLLRVLVDDGLVDDAAVAEVAIGWEVLRGHVLTVTVEEAAERCGIPVDTIRELAHAFAKTERAAMYGGLGLCRGRFGTLGAYLLSAINTVTGKYGREGGVIFGRQALAVAANAMVGGYGDNHTRIGAVPTIAGFMAQAMLPADILEPGDGRVRALIVQAGNPLLTGPGGARLEEALASLELMVSFDLYHNESNRYAHYILPTTTFLERADWPLIGLNALLRPFLQYTDAVVAPRGEAREEFEIYADIARRMGLDAPSPSPEKQEAARGGQLGDPNADLEMALKYGPIGDALGPDRAWSRERLRDHPHGVMIEEMPSGADWQGRIVYPDRKIHLWHDLAGPEFERLTAHRRAEPGRLRLIGRRDIRSMNSWMHNIDRLARSQDPVLLVNPVDAADHALSTGDLARLSTGHGAVVVPVEVSDSIVAGTVSYPHGWGHKAGWEGANRTEGVNMNVLLGIGLDAVEFVSGMTLIDCLDVALERVDAAEIARRDPAVVG